MPKHSLIVILLISSNLIQLFGQESKGVLIDSTLLLKEGIYINVDEFLNNSPSFPYSFKIRVDNLVLTGSKRKKEDYYLDLYTSKGERRIIPLEDVWGFCDGYRIFLNNKGRPYQFLSLGQISILRFVKIYRKDQSSRTLSITLSGKSIIGLLEADFSFYILPDDMIIPDKYLHLNKVLAKDPTIYNLYKKETGKNQWTKMVEYISWYNEVHPLKIERTRILFD